MDIFLIFAYASPPFFVTYQSIRLLSCYIKESDKEYLVVLHLLSLVPVVNVGAALFHFKISSKYLK